MWLTDLIFIQYATYFRMTIKQGIVYDKTSRRRSKLYSDVTNVDNCKSFNTKYNLYIIDKINQNIMACNH